MALAVAPVLDIVGPNEPFVLEMDASGETIGVVFMQGGRLVAFESKKLDRALRNYLAYERELLAIIHAQVAPLLIWSYVWGSIGPWKS